jgi:predicted amidohydrolase YtcJ
MMQVFQGDIVTCDHEGSVFQFLVEEDGRILFVGNDLPAAYRACPHLVDLGSKALLPAFGDGHIHFSNWAVFNSTFDVRSAGSIEEMGPIIKGYADADRKAKVLFGFGLSRHSLREKRLITRRELDHIVKDRPVYLVCYDGHSAVCNTMAVELMPKDILSLRGFDSESGGLFHEAFLRATDFISGRIPAARLLTYIVRGVDTLARYGVGLVHAVEGVGFLRDMDVDLVRFVAKGAQIQFRVYFQTMEIKKALKRKLPRIGGCFACALDGCFGAKDAALLEPYSDDPQNRGILFYSEEQVMAFAGKANRAGLQIQLHCIGDAAVVQAVKAIEAALIDFPRPDHRHTLIHACLIPEPVLETIARLGIGVTLQPGFLISPLEPAEYLDSILGDRARKSSPIKKMMEMGIHVSGGSDGPVTVPDPIRGIHGTCNHLNPEQSVSVAEALRMYTHNIARTSFDERERGTLESGKIADMVVLNRNPLKMSPKDLLQLKVEKVFLAGAEYVQGKRLGRTLLDGLKNRSRLV